MRYRIIKTVLNKAYNSITGIHAEFERENLYKSIGQFGNGSKIMYPWRVSNPKHIAIGDNTFICEGSRLDSYEVWGGTMGISLLVMGVI